MKVKKTKQKKQRDQCGVKPVEKVLKFEASDT